MCRPLPPQSVCYIWQHGNERCSRQVGGWGWGEDMGVTCRRSNKCWVVTATVCCPEDEVERESACGFDDGRYAAHHPSRRWWFQLNRRNPEWHHSTSTGVCTPAGSGGSTYSQEPGDLHLQASGWCWCGSTVVYAHKSLFTIRVEKLAGCNCYFQFNSLLQE